MAQRTLAAPPLNPVLQGWIASHAGSINRIASTLGIPAEALASAPAEEASHIISATRGRHKYYPSKNSIDSLQDFLITTLVPHWGHERNYANRAPDIKSGKKPSTESNPVARMVDYLKEPTKNDVGWGNVNIGSAILYLREYLSEVGQGKKYEGDPLNLAQYKNNYRKMAADLVDPRNDLTFKMAGLVLKRADNAFVNIYDDQYLLLPEDRQAALLVTAYKQGVQRIISNVQTDLLVGAMPVLSDPAAGDGGPFTLFNYPTIKNLLKQRLRVSGAPDPGSEIAGAEAPNPGLNVPNSAPRPISNPWPGSWGGAGDQRIDAVRHPSSWLPSPGFRPYDPNLAEPSQGLASSALKEPYGGFGGPYRSMLDSTFASRPNQNAGPIGRDFLSIFSANLARINGATPGANGATAAGSAVDRPYPWQPNPLLPLGSSAAPGRFAPPPWDHVDQKTQNAAAPLPPTFGGLMPPGFESSLGSTRSNDGGQDISGSAGGPSDPVVVTIDPPPGTGHTSSMPLDPWKQTSPFPWQVPFSTAGVLPTMSAQSPSWLQSVVPSGPIPEILALLATPLSSRGILGSFPFSGTSRGLLDPAALTDGP